MLMSHGDMWPAVVAPFPAITFRRSNQFNWITTAITAIVKNELY